MPSSHSPVFGGKTVLVTGAAGAIGKATAQLLCDQGARVLLADRDPDRLSHVVDMLPADRAQGYVIDVTEDKELSKIVRDAEACGGIDGAVSAAGIEGPVAEIEDCPADAFEAVMTANVKSAWSAIRACLPAMKAHHKGSIVLISSIAGLGGAPSMALYSASKHAVLGLMKTAAREAGPFGVRVNAVCPGPVTSDMMHRLDKALLEKNSQHFGGQQNAAKGIPLKRYATPEEVAQMIAFLCSDASSYCSGGVHLVDGGLTAR